VSAIFVLDDDRTFRELLRTVFELEGYQAVIVPGPDDLVPMAYQTRPDLVLMDVHLLGGDTFGVLRQLREDEVLRDVPVVMTSGMDLRGECLDAGADAFLAKPFRPSELLALIGGMLDGQDEDR